MDLTSPALHCLGSHRLPGEAMRTLHDGGVDVRKLCLVSQAFDGAPRARPASVT